jgi:hypothetical protein
LFGGSFRQLQACLRDYTGCFPCFLGSKGQVGFLNDIEELLERLDQAPDVIDTPGKTRKTTDIGTLF